MLRGQVQVQSGQLLDLSEAVALPSELADWHNRDLSHPFYWGGFTVIGSLW